MVNAKLDRPLDSHAPQTEQMYYYNDDDWGEQHEHEDEDQWDQVRKQLTLTHHITRWLHGTMTTSIAAVKQIMH